MSVLHAPVPLPPPRDGGTRRSRRTAFAAGALYLITFLTSVPTLALYRPVLDHDDFVPGLGQHHQRPGRDIARGAPGRFLCRHGRGPLPGRRRHSERLPSGSRRPG